MADYANEQSIRNMFEQTGNFDVLIAVAGGNSQFRQYSELTDVGFRFGFERKFLGEVRLVRLGEHFARDNCSLILTSGFLSHYQNAFSIATGPLNAAVGAFVTNTAQLLPRNLRINVVSPAPIIEPGQEGRGLVTAEETAKLYVEAVDGDFSGRVLRAWGGLPISD